MSALPAGKSAPRFSLTATSGQKLSLAEALKTGPVLAAFFKVSCPTCQFTFPFLERIHEIHAGKNFTLWGISQNDARDTREFNKEFGLRFPVLLDEPGFPVSNQYGITNVPTLFLISPEGTIRISSVGFAKDDLEKAAAEAARASHTPAAPIFKPGEVVPQYKPG
jgi:cytochrome c biogenesis protein CcmG/thiol:disulfide interchange protein DsbE